MTIEDPDVDVVVPLDHLDAALASVREGELLPWVPLDERHPLEVAAPPPDEHRTVEARVVEVLSAAARPMTAKDIAGQLGPKEVSRVRYGAAKHDCDRCNHYPVERFEQVVDGREAWYQSVYQALNRMRDQGLAARIDRTPGQPAHLWSLVDEHSRPAALGSRSQILEARMVPVRGRLVLHSVEGPAVRYADGTERYMVNGIHVPRRVVTEPETLDASDVHREGNIEVRRIMLERMGVERYLESASAEEVSRDEFGTLYRIMFDSTRDPVGPGEEVMVVKVVNSTPEPDGTFKDYYLLVDPNAYGGLETARAAVASTWRVEQWGQDESRWPLAFEKPEHYDPAVQT